MGVVFYRRLPLFNHFEPGEYLAAYLGGLRAKDPVITFSCEYVGGGGGGGRYADHILMQFHPLFWQAINTALMQFGLYGERCRFGKLSALFGLTKATAAAGESLDRRGGGGI